MTKIIAVTNENNIDLAIKDLSRKINIKNIERITGTIFKFETNLDFNIFFEQVNKKNVFFIQYIFPILIEKPLSLSSKDGSILPQLFETQAISFKQKNISIHLTFIDTDLPYTKSEFLTPFLALLNKNGYVLSPKNATMVLPVLVCKHILYIGKTLKISQLLSSWPLGRSRYLVEEDQICRAEFKILDVLDSFGLDLTSFKTAIDLGAAPGGWTRLLLKAGLHVISVDPADMDIRLKKYPNFMHYKGLSQEFFKNNEKKKYDLIVNDMRMSVSDTVKIMNEVAKNLSAKGRALVTFKLDPKRKIQEATQGIHALTQKYKIIHARQLFHNRSEITVLLEPK